MFVFLNTNSSTLYLHVLSFKMKFPANITLTHLKQITPEDKNLKKDFYSSPGALMGKAIYRA